MFFAPRQLPATYPFVFSTTYNPVSTPPNTAAFLTNFQGLRDWFYGYFNGVQQNGELHKHDDFNEAQCLEYLNQVPDLIRYGVTEANFPIAIQWQSGAFPGGNAHQVPNDNEVACTTELIWSRITYAWGACASLRGNIAEVRTAKAHGNHFEAFEKLKGIKPRLASAAIRLFKLNYSQDLIYPGLKGQSGPVECVKDYAVASYNIVVVNLSSLMCELQILNPNGTFGPEQFKLCNSLAAHSLRRLHDVRETFKTLDCPMGKDVIAWTGVCEQYFKALQLIAGFKIAAGMSDDVIEKPENKTLEEVYIECKVLGDAIYNLKESVDHQVSSCGPNIDNFNIKEGLLLIQKMFDSELLDKISTAIGRYENIKDSFLRPDLIAKFSFDYITSQWHQGEDQVNAWVTSQANVPQM